MKRLVFLLLLVPLASAALAQGDSLKNGRWNGIWDPTDPNCPCYSIQKQAEEEYRQMLAEEQRQKELAQKQEEEKRLAELAQKQEEEKKRISDGGRPGDNEENAERNNSNPVNTSSNENQQEQSTVTVTNINGNTKTVRFMQDTAQGTPGDNDGEGNNQQQDNNVDIQVNSNPGNNSDAAATDSSSVSSGGSGSSGGGSYPSTGKTKTFKKKFRKFRHNAANKTEKIFPKRKKKRKLLDDCWH